MDSETTKPYTPPQTESKEESKISTHFFFILPVLLYGIFLTIACCRILSETVNNTLILANLFILLWGLCVGMMLSSSLAAKLKYRKIKFVTFTLLGTLSQLVMFIVVTYIIAIIFAHNIGFHR